MKERMNNSDDTRKLKTSEPDPTLGLLQEHDDPKLTFPEPAKLETPTVEEHILYMRERQARMERLSRNSEYAEVKIESDTPIGINLSGDWQYGSAETDYETLHKHFNIVQENPNLYMTALSNTIDGFIWPGGMWSELEHLEQQVEFAAQFGREWRDKLLAVVGSRCHDWTKDKGGISPQEIAFRENVDNGMPFFQHGGVLNVKLNDIDYKIAMMHKSRFHSSLNVTNANKRVLDMRWPSADVVAIAHHHVAAIEHAVRWEGPDRRDVVLARTGTYKIEDSFSKDLGIGTGQMGGVTVVLDPREKQVTPFLKLETANEYINLKRGAV